MNWLNSKSPLAGGSYPFLARLGFAWALQSRPLEEAGKNPKELPCLRWVNEQRLNDLYIQGMDTERFLKACGLELSMKQGGFVLSKRLSRIFRPYWIYGFFPRESISVRYLEQDEAGMKRWDGAGRISRRLLLRLIAELPPELPIHKRRQMEHELRHARRIEFTVMGLADWSAASYGGQDKGHAAVIENLDVDLELPRDTKGQVCLRDGTVFIGLYPVHAADEMRLDIQSLINLHPFFRQEDLLAWLHEEGQLFLQAVFTGDVASAMLRLRSGESLEELQRWHLREYFVSGGHPMWFGSILKAFINQHLKRISHQALEELRLPIPGMRYYLMLDEIGYRAVARGQICLEAESATAWINAEDWCEYASERWGGADQDDALWCFPFSDEADGKVKILAWRSPNQFLEYLLFEPSADSHLAAWKTSTGSITCPSADSRLLPEPADFHRPEYLNLLDEHSAAGLGENHATYSIAAMESTIRRAQSNRGTLGIYCNSLMLCQALYGTLPKQAPAALEQVIDASVKTGLNLLPVKQWCYDASFRILLQAKPIPRILHSRLAIDYEAEQGPPRPKSSHKHWLDLLVQGVEAHIAQMEEERDYLMTQCQPPLQLFQAAFDEGKYLKLGALFTKGYTAKLPWIHGKQGRRSAGSLEAARLWSEAFLEPYSPGEQSAILIGSLAHYYLKPKHNGADEAAWQLGARDEEGRREAGIAHSTVAALRAIGLLDELALKDGFLLSYPGAQILEMSEAPLILRNVWFNYLRADYERARKPAPEQMQTVSQEEEERAKTEISQLAQTRFRGLELSISKQDERLVAQTMHGRLFAYLPKEEERFTEGAKLRICYALAKDGHLTVIYKRF